MRLMAGGIVLLLLITPASAEVLCKSKKGAVKARAGCKSTETQLDLSALGSQGPPGPQGEQGLTGPQGPGLVVRDATGALVGHVIERGNPLGVGRIVGTTLVFFSVTAAGVPDAPQLRYESPDCSGEPWVGVQPPGLMAYLAVRASIGHFTVASSGSNVLIQSEWVPNGSDYYCSAVNFVSQMVRPTVVDLTALVPPFHVEEAAP